MFLLKKIKLIFSFKLISQHLNNIYLRFLGFEKRFTTPITINENFMSNIIQHRFSALLLVLKNQCCFSSLLLSLIFRTASVSTFVKNSTNQERNKMQNLIKFGFRISPSKIHFVWTLHLLVNWFLFRDVWIRVMTLRRRLYSPSFCSSLSSSIDPLFYLCDLIWVMSCRWWLWM